MNTTILITGTSSGLGKPTTRERSLVGNDEWTFIRACGILSSDCASFERSPFEGEAEGRL